MHQKSAHALNLMLDVAVILQWWSYFWLENSDKMMSMMINNQPTYKHGGWLQTNIFNLCLKLSISTCDLYLSLGLLLVSTIL